MRPLRRLSVSTALPLKLACDTTILSDESVKELPYCWHLRLCITALPRETPVGTLDSEEGVIELLR